MRLRNRLALRFWHVATVRQICLWANATTCSTRGYTPTPFQRIGPTGSGRPRPVEISGEAPPAVRSIRQSGDVSGVLEAARRSAEAEQRAGCRVQAAIRR